MDCSIASHGNDHIIALFARLLRQLDGVTRIDGAAPIHVSAFFCDRTQVTCHAPGVSHICHRVEDNFYFAMHAVSLENEFLRSLAKVLLIDEFLPSKPSQGSLDFQKL